MTVSLLPLLRARADNATQGLPFSQDWTNTGLITADDSWLGVPGVVGFRGDGLTSTTGVDPQTVVAESLVVDVNANQTTPNTFGTGGVTEFHLADPTIAIKGSGTARAPYVQFHLNTTGLSSINVSYKLRDIDGSTNNTVQPVALQYRVGASGNFTNVPAGFVSDATTGPSVATKVTAVSAVLPAAVDNKPLVQVRVITTDAVGTDEWVGVDDISITGSTIPLPTNPSGTGAASPAAVDAGSATLLTVQVTPGTNPTSTGLAVTADLSSIGGSAAQAFFDNGSNGDAVANDNTFSFSLNVPAGAAPGGRTFPVLIADAQGRGANASIVLLVRGIVISEVDADTLLTGTDTTNEWFELQNVTSSTVTLTNWKVTDNNSTDTLPTVTLGPGGHVIVAATGGGFSSEHSGFAGTVLAIADGAIGNGLANGGDRLILRDENGVDVDCVSWGSNLTCLSPSAPSAGDTTTIQRDAAGTDTDTAADWKSAAPSPDGDTHTGSVNPAGAGGANPNSVAEGNTSLLTVAVTPGLNPPSTGLAVTADLSTIGGSAAQVFFDNGSNGDAVANDNTFSYLATVPAGTALGVKSMPAVITDAESRVGNATITLTIVPPPPPPIGIGQIQGSGAASPYVGQLVTTNGVVTALKGNGFFLQTADGLDDGDPATSEGVLVFTSTAPTVAVGDSVTVTATVSEFFNLTELAGSPAITVHSHSNPLPEPVTLTTSILDAAGTRDQMERFEGMRLHADSLVSVSPTNGFGETFTVLEGVARPFREPGIEASLALPPGSPCCVPRFDQNPELIMIDSDGQAGASPISVTSNVTFSNVTGPLDFTFGDYKIVPDAPPATTANMTAVPVPVPAADEFTVASFNMERFFNATNDPGDDTVLSAAEYAKRLKKASLAIRNVMRSPDIIGIEEMENISTLQDVANKVNSDTVAAGGANPQYQPYLVEGNDPGGIDVGFLVKSSRVSVDSVTQEGKNATYTQPDGATALLNDRPPLVLRAHIQSPTGSQFPLTVVVNHLRSLLGIGEDPGAGPRVREKRRRQAEYLASLLQSMQGENLVVVGDFNSFQFSDGYVDVIGTVKGQPAPPDQVVLASPDIVNPDLTGLVDTLPQEQRYSYSFAGNAQTIDHVLVDEEMLARNSRYAVARNDADFPESFRGDDTRPERISDHDMPVAYFTFPPPQADLEVSAAASPEPVVSGSNVTYTVAVTNHGADNATGVVVTDTLPAGTAFVSCSSTGGGVCGGAGNSRTVTFASLPIGATETVTIVASTDCALADGSSLVNAATAVSAVTDPDTSNNTRSASTTVSNPAPVVVAPADVTYECATSVPAANAAAAQVSDNCGTPSVSVAETNNGGAGSAANPLVITRVFKAVDGAGNVGTATQTITVADGTAPAITGASVDKSVLGPPNHQMVDVAVNYGATDGCGTVSTSLSVSSNEPQNGTGDGDTASDWEVVDNHHVRLRAERAGTGTGRIYTITITATDGVGNTSTRTLTVQVPRGNR